MPIFQPAQSTKRILGASSSLWTRNALLDGKRFWQSLSLAALTLLPFPAFALVASAGQLLWLAGALLGVLVAFGPRSPAILKMVEVVAAAALCSLALVNIDAY